MKFPIKIDEQEVDEDIIDSFIVDVNENIIAGISAHSEHYNEGINEIIRRANAHDDLMKLVSMCISNYVSETNWLNVSQEAHKLFIKHNV